MRHRADPGKFKITEDAASRTSIQSEAGFSRDSGLVVWPLIQKRHSSASTRSSPIIILIVIRKENNNLWASKRLRHTCGRIVTKPPREALRDVLMMSRWRRDHEDAVFPKFKLKNRSACDAESARSCTQNT